MALGAEIWHYSEIVNSLTELRAQKLNEGHEVDNLKWIIGEEVITCLRKYCPVACETLPPMILGIVFEVVQGQDIKLVEKQMIGQSCTVTFKGKLINATPDSP